MLGLLSNIILVTLHCSCLDDPWGMHTAESTLLCLTRLERESSCVLFSFWFSLPRKEWSLFLAANVFEVSLYPAKRLVLSWRVKFVSSTFCLQFLCRDELWWLWRRWHENSSTSGSKVWRHEPLSFKYTVYYTVFLCRTLNLRL
jgi:hypothetical protein